MKKKSSRTSAKQLAAPQSAQLEAVRKLSHAGRYGEALARIDELRSRYPTFKPLLALAWEVNDYCSGQVFSDTPIGKTAAIFRS